MHNILLVGLCLLLVSCAQGSDRAMCELIDATNIPARKAALGWSGWSCTWLLGIPTATNLCSWTGVTCSSGVLQSVSVPSSGITGTFPASIGSLDMIHTFNLGDNSFSNTLPSSMGSMTKLQSLRLHSNSLAGTLPTSFSKLTLLTTMELHSNAITGAVPSSFTNLNNLVSLSLHSTSLNGAYPAGLCSQTKLTTFYLSSSVYHECHLPTSAPTSSPTFKPTFKPTAAPTSVPTSVPTVTHAPTAQPTKAPTSSPTSLPTSLPSTSPTSLPTSKPTTTPTSLPTAQPSVVPTSVPTAKPSSQPTSIPTDEPTSVPSSLPTSEPTSSPTSIPSSVPSSSPSASPSALPSAIPTSAPSSSPTAQPSTSTPSVVPSAVPSSIPTSIPSSSPTATRTPTSIPSSAPSGVPSSSPSALPTSLPTTATPSSSPTSQPTSIPTDEPTSAPSGLPTSEPTSSPTSIPSSVPSSSHSASPSALPSAIPTSFPSSGPTATRTPTSTPTLTASGVPSSSPSFLPTSIPTPQPTSIPTARPTSTPTAQPTSSPTAQPTSIPTAQPTSIPTSQPTSIPTAQPTSSPTSKPTSIPTVQPTSTPTVQPTSIPTAQPTSTPTLLPSNSQSSAPSAKPTRVPTSCPTALPTYTPSAKPTHLPTSKPTIGPTISPSPVPVATPVLQPTRSPTSSPTHQPAPQLIEAYFSNDASQVLFRFDMATDRARLKASFDCSTLFVLSTKEQCQWSNGDAVVIMYLNGKSVVLPGDAISLRSGLIRAKCSSSCDGRPTSSAQSISVAAPSDPVMPAVSVSAPTALGRCDWFLLDLSGSTGSGGRAWVSHSVDVTSSNGNHSLINDFFSSQYAVSPPTPVSNHYFTAGESYSFKVTLCNFVGDCGVAWHNITVSASSFVPVIQILGTNVRSMRSRDVLSLLASAYVSKCDGSRSSSGLTYTWSVMKDGSAAVGVTSIAKKDNAFVLPRFALAVNSVYEISVDVTRQVNGVAYSSSDSITVNVVPGSVVAVIAGGGTQSVRYGEWLMLDASTSYDEDVHSVRGVEAGLLFSWSCISGCDWMNMTETDRADMIRVRGVNSSAVGESAMIQVDAQSIANARSSSVAVVVTIGPSLAPVVNLYNSSSRVHDSKPVRLLASVTVGSPVTASWSVNDTSLNLQSAALSSTKANLMDGTFSFHLVLPSHALAASTAYTFTLSCGSSTAAVVVTTISVPRPGSFSVSPSMGGIELSTSFAWSASQWSDNEYPLSYAFGFMAEDGLLLVKSRSEVSVYSSHLPRGNSQENYRVVCVVEVFNALDAKGSLSYDVEVSPSSMTALEISSILADMMELAQNETDGDTLKQQLSVGSAVLNAANCSLAPNCTDLNRGSCSNVAHTCSACLSGYIGEDGAANSYCFVDSNNTAGAALGESCAVDYDCGVLLQCDDSGICNYPMKSCYSECSHRGRCSFVHDSTGDELSRCFANDTSCSAVCVCSSGYAGTLCDMTEADLEAKQSSRELMIEALVELLNNELLTTDETIVGITASLASLGSHHTELTSSACTLLLNMTHELVNAASDAGIAPDDMQGILDVLDECFKVVAASGNVDNDVRRLQDSAGNSGVAVNSFLSFVTNSMLVGQNPHSYIRDMYRSSSFVWLGSSNSTLSSPRSRSEELFSASASTIRLIGRSCKQALQVSMLESASRLRSTANSTSNAVRVQLGSTSSDEYSETIYFTIPNNSPQPYGALDPVGEVVTTVCPRFSYKQVNHTCSSGYVVRHECNGTAVTLSTTCPVRQLRPACEAAYGSISEPGEEKPLCSMESYDANTISCVCIFSSEEYKRVSSGPKNPRALENSGALEVVAISVIAADDFADTIYDTNDLTAADAEDSILVIVMFIALWVFAIAAILVVSLSPGLSNSQVAVAEMDRRKTKTETATTESIDPMERRKEHILRYIETIFPAVYRGGRSLVYRLYKEVLRHHRYVRVFNNSKNITKQGRVNIILHMLTLQTMLIFLLAVFYDVQMPVDDGSCEEHMREDKCLHDKLEFDLSQRKCEWVTKHEGTPQEYQICQFRDPAFTWKVLIIASVVIGIATGPINMLVDFLFDDILSAPTADEYKRSKQNTALAAIKRTVSTAVRRASKATLGAVGALQQVTKRRTVRQTLVLDETTRQLPSAVTEARNIASTAMIKEESKGGWTSVMPVNTIPEPKERGYDNFISDFMKQRNKFSARNRILFDLLWGWDAKNQCFEYQKRSISLCPSPVEMILQKELDIVEKESVEKIAKLRTATDEHIGLEIIHLFVIDLLGRNTPAAQIFRYKTEEDFRHTMVVTAAAKQLTWCVVLLLNLFFVYFTLVRSMTRNSSWQTGFLTGCVFQFLVEICFNETVECIWINFSIPRLVRQEIDAVLSAFHKTLDYTFSREQVLPVLDTPKYFFVSNRVAAEYRKLFDSQFVLDYHTFWPGNMCTRWTTPPETKGSGIRRFLSVWLKRFSLSLHVSSLLRIVGTCPLHIQRLIFHFALPIIFSLMVLALAVMIATPAYFLPVLGYAAYEGLVHCSRQWSGRKANAISPVLSELERSESGYVLPFAPA